MPCLDVSGFYLLLWGEGGSITVKCRFYLSGSRKLFCKEKCENGNILVETSDDAAQNGRYSIKYVKTYITYYPTLYVSITQLKQSDSGRYRCSLERVLLTDGNSDFELIVTEGEPSLKRRLDGSTPSSIDGAFFQVFKLPIPQILMHPRTIRDEGF
uniref:Immunoglobulin subtype domain-containing protein n=1 Tax=Pundamilia nyererei TaxID=303518 RepID=A0A3B4GVP7_9CICH